MSRTSLADLCEDGNSLISELQNQMNGIRNNIDMPSYIERDVYMMGYIVKRLDRLQKSLTQKIEAEGCV